MFYSKLFAIIAAAGLALAQGQQGQQGHQSGQMNQGGGSGVDMSKVQTIEGAVSAVNIGYGSQYPSIQINQTTIKVAPVWYLLEKDFEIKTGDKLKVTAAPSLQSNDPYLSAITVANTVTGASITLRNAGGVPLWTSQQGMGAGQGNHDGGDCTGPVSIATVSGTVVQVTAGAGIQMPSLVLKKADGQLITIKLGPERALNAADFEINPGDTLTVRYAVTITGENVALELTNAAGVKLTLRSGDMHPGWN